jgi:hypothetical protein
MGTRGSYPWGKAAGREADHSPLPQYAFMAQCSVKEKAQGQIYFYLLLYVESKLILDTFPTGLKYDS